MAENIPGAPGGALDRKSALTLGEQLKTIIRDKISTGEWAANAMIPSENELSQIYGVSRMTVRAAITQFVQQGYLYRIQGKGTFVGNAKLEIRSLHYGGIREQLEADGYQVATTLLSCEQLPARGTVARMLNLPVGQSVYLVRRVRAANGTNISYHTTFIPAALCPGLETRDLQNEQLCQILERDYMLVSGHVEETLESFFADGEMAGHLSVKPNFPLLLLRDRIFTPDHTAFEFSCVYFRGDKIRIQLEYHNDKPAGLS